jgi:hypothetical protein
VGLVCLGALIAVRAIWPGMFSQAAGLGAVSLGLFPSLGVLPIVIGNVALSVIARRRGGRAASIGSFCLWTMAVFVLLSLAVSLTPPAVFQAAHQRVDLVLFLLLAMGASLPAQLLVLAFLAFAVIGSSRAGATGHTA